MQSSICHRQILSAEDQQNVNDLHSLFHNIEEAQQSTDGVSYLRAPLHLALLISPIYLLLPAQHFKKSYNWSTMLAISSCLGNSKPRLIFDVEIVIWKVLCSLVTGMGDPFDILHQLSDNLPWDHIQAASSTDSEWFNLGQFVPSMRRVFC
jgi:hypothetical protein